MNRRSNAGCIAGLAISIFFILTTINPRLLYDACLYNDSSSQLQNSLGSKQPNNETARTESHYSGQDAKWRLVWQEEFNDEVLEESYWIKHVGGGIWGNNELQYYTDRAQNCYLENGKLMIKACNEAYQEYDFTSARVSTKTKLSFLYGRIEVCAKLPKGKGLLSAIWLLPCENNYDNRKKSGEIDIVEVLGNDPGSAYGVAHYSFGNDRRTYEKYNDGITDLSEKFHVYALEWTPDEIKWEADSICYLTLDMRTAFDDTYRPFNHSMYLIINLAIGGDWPGNDFSETVFPIFLEIEYVRYYVSGGY